MTYTVVDDEIRHMTYLPYIPEVWGAAVVDDEERQALPRCLVIYTFMLYICVCMHMSTRGVRHSIYRSIDRSVFMSDTHIYIHISAYIPGR